MKCAQKVCVLRCVFMTPLGMPVVPPVGDSTTTSSMSKVTCGGDAGWSAIQDCSECDPETSGASPSVQIHARIPGMAARNSAMTAANSRWKNRISQSNASSSHWFSCGGLRAPTGIQHRLARQSPSVHTHAVTSFPAQTAPLLSRRNPLASNAFAIRQDRSPISSNVNRRSSWT